MSKASEWAAARQRRLAELEIERQNIRREIEEPESPGCSAAYLVESSGEPRVAFRQAGGYGVYLGADEAVTVAHWILDVFGEQPQISAGPPASGHFVYVPEGTGSFHSNCLRVGERLLFFGKTGEVITIDRSDARGAILTLRAVTDDGAGPISD